MLGRFRRLDLVCDLDGIVVDLANSWLGVYNRAHGDSVTVHDLKSWEMADNVKAGHKVYDYLSTPSLFLDAEPLPGSIEALRALHEKGHTIHIVTAPAKASQTAADKLEWCRRHLPFLKRQQITTSHQKERILTDVFIDDSPENIRKHAAIWPHTKRIGIAWPYNEVVKDLMHVRADSYVDTKAAWATLLEAIDEFAHTKT